MTKLKTVSSHQGRTFAMVCVLAILSALSFLKYLGWAAFYSGNLSLGDMAGQRAELFLLVFILLEVLTALVIASRIRLEDTFLSNAIRLVVGCGMGLLASILTTGIIVGALVTIRSRLRR